MTSTTRPVSQRKLIDRNTFLERTLLDMHHRVKNHFQMLAALLEVQTDEHSHTLSSEGVTRLHAHLHALAALHDLLTQQARERANEDQLSARTVLDRLIVTMQTLAEGKRLHYHAEEVTISARRAAVLAIIAQELINNALKYGSENVEITLTSRDEDAVMKVCDDGPGFPARFAPRRSSGVGLELIERMSHQDMQGSVRYENQPCRGACVVVEFPLNVDNRRLNLQGEG